MNFDFPLILMLLTLVTGLIAGLDKFYLAKTPKKSRAAATAGEANSAIAAAEKESFAVEQSKSFSSALIVFVLRSLLPSLSDSFRLDGAWPDQGRFYCGQQVFLWPALACFDITLVPTGEPQRGDVMVFFPPEDPRYFIKRVIGFARRSH